MVLHRMDILCFVVPKVITVASTLKTQLVSQDSMTLSIFIWLRKWLAAISRSIIFVALLITPSRFVRHIASGPAVMNLHSILIHSIICETSGTRKRAVKAVVKTHDSLIKCLPFIATVVGVFYRSHTEDQFADFSISFEPCWAF